MAEKTFLRNLCNLWFISGILLLSISVPLCLADEDAEIFKQERNIWALIDNGKFDEAKTATAQMLIEFPGSAKLPDMLYWIAERYQRVDRFDDAKQIQEQIIRDFPDSPWAGKARLGRARSEAMSLVISGNYTEAKAVTAQMASDFAGNPDLAELLFWIGERFQRADRFDEARQIYQQIVRNFPDSKWANKASVASSRAQIESLIVSQKYDDANTAIVQLIADFAKSPDLPGALFWLTERFERAAQLDDARQNYQRIMEQFPNNLYAKRAKLGISRAEVIGLIEANDFNNAGIALNKMTSDFAGDADLPWSLYLVAQRYESKGKQEDANSVYQNIVQNYPDNIYASKAATLLRPLGYAGQADVNDVNLNPDLEKAAMEIYRAARGYEEANDFNSAAKAYEQVIRDYQATIKGSNAVLDIRRLEILNAINSNEANQADTLLNKYVDDFNQNPYAGDCLDLLVDKCFWTATELKIQNKPQQANSRLARTEGILQIIIDKKTAGNSTIGSSDNLAGLYYYAAGCRQQQGKWDEAIEYFQKVVHDYPFYERACGAQAAVGWCYEALRDSNQAPKEAINPLAEEAYKAVLAQYSYCFATNYTVYRLAELSIEKGDKVNAIMYYKKYLELARQGDPRIEMVKAKIASLEEENK